MSTKTTKTKGRRQPAPKGRPKPDEAGFALVRYRAEVRELRERHAADLFTRGGGLRAAVAAALRMGAEVLRYASERTRHLGLAYLYALMVEQGYPPGIARLVCSFLYWTSGKVADLLAGFLLWLAGKVDGRGA
jgi:hypothetical protein